MAENNTALEETIAKLNKNYGNDTIMKLDELPETEEIVSTGIMGLDIALGVGGIRKGSIVEIYGTESAGKTTLALQLCKQFQKNDLPVLYIDTERTLTRETIEGIGITNDNFYIVNVDTLEDALEVCKISAPSFGAIVIDSLAGLATKAQIEGGVGDSHVGVFPKIMSNTLPVLTPILDKSGCTLIIITQLREKVGVMFGNPEHATGGRALKYYATVRLEIRRSEPIKKDGEAVGNRVRAKVIKNKIAAPFKSTEFDIMFGKGISVEGNMLDCAIQENIITRRGVGYYYGNKRIGQSLGMVKTYFQEHPSEMGEIVDELRKIQQI